MTSLVTGNDALRHNSGTHNPKHHHLLSAICYLLSAVANSCALRLGHAELLDMGLWPGPQTVLHL